MRTTAAVDTQVQEAVGRARSGRPTVLDLEGAAGFGKTHLAREVAGRFDPRATLWASGYEGREADPLDLLDQLGVAGGVSDPLRASRALGAYIDGLPDDDIRLLVLDDLQWSDPESVDAIGVLMQRMAGDRVLLVAGHRPSGSRHVRWLQHLQDVPSVVRVRLDGFDAADTLALLRSVDPIASEGLAESLTLHTGGSPLFLTSLLREHPVPVLETLSRRGELPVPRDLIAAIGDRLSRSDPTAVATLSALAVLGSHGAEPAIIGQVAGVEDVASAIDVLAQDGLVISGAGGPASHHRVYHDVVRTAVYANIPVATRTRMHSIAAARSHSPEERLTHRVAASTTFDDGLAGDLERFADRLHEQTRYREAARLRRQAAHLSSQRERSADHLLEADIEAILALDVDDLSVRESEVAMDPRARYVIGAAHAARKRFVDSSDILGGLTDDELDALPGANAYRARVWRAWSFVAAGRSAESAGEDLRAADAAQVTDVALHGYATLAAGQVALRTAPKGQTLSLPVFLSVDRTEMASTPQGTVQLAWRGAVLSLTGMPREAIDDLSVVTDRFGDGVMEFGEGVFHAMQGFAHFIYGQWPRAAMMVDLSRAARFRHVAPLTAAIEPIVAVVAGDADRAVRMAREARRVRILGPQPAAIHAGDIVEVLTLFFLGEQNAQREWFEGRLADFGDPARWMDEQNPHLWYVALAIGAAWAARPADVRMWASRLRAADPPAWGPLVVDWLDARVDDSPSGRRRVRELARSGIPDVPVVDAILQVDAALGTSDDIAQRETAVARLRRLGAYPLAERLFAPDEGAEPTETADFLAPLSDRERDVAALILEGLTYEQIAKELFITRSTVTFHSSRIFAKTGVGSRPEFVLAARAGR